MASAASAAAFAPMLVPGAASARRSYAKNARVLRAAPRSVKPTLRAAPGGAVRAAAVAEKAPAPAGTGGVDRGSGYEVHKFGGTCVGSAERISGCCDLLIASATSGVKTFGVVSAMGVANKGEPKVTDCLINATEMASTRNPLYMDELVKLERKHQTTAEALLTDQEEYDRYMNSFAEELEDLKAMLKAMSIAGTSTQAFADFVVGHGELWTARLCAAAIRCKGFDAEWIDARDVLVVTDAEDGGVDVDYEGTAVGAFPNPGTLFDALYGVRNIYQYWYSLPGVRSRKSYHYSTCTRGLDCLFTVHKSPITRLGTDTFFFLPSLQQKPRPAI